MADVDAPVVVGDMKPDRFTYDEGCDFIIEHFAGFGPKLSAFAKHALENRWVEARTGRTNAPAVIVRNCRSWKNPRFL